MEANQMKKPIKTEMQIGTLPNPYEIKPEDLDRHIDIAGDFGRVIFCDVGKLLYLRGGLIQMESDEQKEARLNKLT